MYKELPKNTVCKVKHHHCGCKSVDDPSCTCYSVYSQEVKQRD